MNTDEGDVQVGWLATVALRAAVDKDWTRSFGALVILSQRHGGDGLIEAMLSWCDSLIGHTGGYGANATPIGPVQFEAIGVGIVDQAPEAIEWAHKLITAQQAMDSMTVQELLYEMVEIPDNNRHVTALLNITSVALAEHLKTCPAGIDGACSGDPDALVPGRWPTPPAGHTWN